MKAIFKTKLTQDYDRNGQTVEIIKTKRDNTGLRHIIKFADGYIIEWVYDAELDFGY